MTLLKLRFIVMNNYSSLVNLWTETETVTLALTDREPTCDRNQDSSRPFLCCADNLGMAGQTIYQVGFYKTFAECVRCCTHGEDVSQEVLVVTPVGAGSASRSRSSRSRDSRSRSRSRSRSHTCSK